MSGTDNETGSRRPEAFSIDDPSVRVTEAELNAPDLLPVNDSGSAAYIRTGIGWSSIFFSAVGGLILLSLTVWIMSYVTSLFFRQDWIGWLSLFLLGVACLSAFMIIVREVFGLLRLRRQGELKYRAELALEDRNLPDARKVVSGIELLLANREDLRWGFSRLKDHRRNVLDADELLILAEREVMMPLDGQVRDIIATSARRVAFVTTLSPAAVVDVIYVAYENLALLRRIAILYGGRPGVYGLLKLGRMVLTHLTLTGGLALTADMLQQFLGQRVAAKISAKLGEGLFNGTLTARIGLAAVDVCRPLPFIRSKKPTVRELVGALVSGAIK